MTRLPVKISATPAIAVLALALLLTGCAAPAATTNSSSSSSKDDDKEDEKEQTVKAACKELETASLDVATGITDATGDLTDDPAAAAVAITTTAEDFDAAVADIENEKVREAAGPVVDAISEFAAIIEAYAADPANADIAALTESSNTIDESFTAIGEVCS